MKDDKNINENSNEKEEINVKELYKDKIEFLDEKQRSFIINMEEHTQQYHNLKILSQKEVFQIVYQSHSIYERLLTMRLVVVTYARVSTNHKEQRNSISSQIKYFERSLRHQKTWIYTKMYVDEGISGTSIKNRKAFNQMINDALDGKIDLILIKDVSRFARNTVDCLGIVRKLTAKGVIVYFQTDNIISVEPDAEARLTDTVRQAQEESRRQSVKVKFGLETHAEEGNPLGHKCFGYKIQDCRLVICQKEAELLKEIARLILSGKSEFQIKCIMEQKGELSPKGLKSWNNVQIYRMMKNPKLRGDQEHKNDIVANYLDHTVIKNDGRIPKIYVKQTHKGIFSYEEHMKIVKEIDSRSPDESENERRKYSNRYPFSSKVYCGLCNHTFHRKAYHRKKEMENWVWCCSQNARYGLKNEQGERKGCNSKGIHEPILQKIFMLSLKHVIEHQNEIIEIVNSIIKSVIDKIEPLEKKESRLKTELERIKNNKMSTVELFNQQLIDKNTLSDMLKKYSVDEDDVLQKLQKVGEEISDKTPKVLEKSQTIDFLIEKCVNFCVDEFNEDYCRSMLDRIIVYSREKIAIFIKGEENPNFFSGYPPVLIAQDL